VPPDPLSVGVLVPSASRRAGGLFTAVVELSRAVAALGHRVTVYAPRDGDSERDLPAWFPLVPKLFDPRGPATFSYAPGLAAALEAGDHDVVHQHGLWQYPSVVSARWTRRTGRPVVVSPHGMLDPWALRHAGWKKRLAGLAYETRNLSGAACLHALAEAEARAVAAHCGGRRVAVVPNGVDPGPAPVPRRTEGRRELLFLGRIHPKKGIAELVDAWALMARQTPAVAASWRLTVAGWDDGGHLPGLRERVAARGLEGSVTFPGPLFGPAKRDALTRAAAFVLPSRSEGLPMAVLEAWASGLPVLMTAACNLPDGFRAGAAIEIPEEPGPMAEVLARALADPALADAGIAGRRLVEARYRWEHVAADHVAVYRWLLGRDAAPACVAGAPARERPASDRHDRGLEVLS
jgi:poly(glycerol-phosphate) alpha-glucosyltransferase